MRIRDPFGPGCCPGPAVRSKLTSVSSIRHCAPLQVIQAAHPRVRDSGPDIEPRPAQVAGTAGNPGVPAATKKAAGFRRRHFATFLIARLARGTPETSRRTHSLPQAAPAVHARGRWASTAVLVQSLVPEAGFEHLSPARRAVTAVTAVVMDVQDRRSDQASAVRAVRMQFVSGVGK
jgi:hypothetical protein